MTKIELNIMICSVAIMILGVSICLTNRLTNRKFNHVLSNIYKIFNQEIDTLRIFRQLIDLLDKRLEVLELKNKKGVKIYTTEKKNKKKEEKREIKKCLQCGKEITFGNSKRKYCSDSCRQKANRK